MGMFDKLLENLKAERKSIVFTEGTDERILTAADRLLKEDLMDVVLVGKPDEIEAAAKAGGFDISKAEIVDPDNFDAMEEMVQMAYELRGGDAQTRFSLEQTREDLKKGNNFGTMLVKMGRADSLLGGATYSTADTVRPILQFIKAKPGNNLVSSCFILVREKDGVEERIAMGDCAINISYVDWKDKEGNVIVSAARQLGEVAVETARTAEFFGIDPKVAVLSYSTYGSGSGSTVQLSHDAVLEARAMDPELKIDGELQFDAAVSPVVAKTKCPDSDVAGQANTFIFPLIEAGNIGYKIAQRLGGYKAYGPILQGLNGSLNDLSRGCDAEEVYMMSIVTAGMA